MIQYVHNVSYLSVRQISTSEYERDAAIKAIALPTNAEIVKVDLEVTEECGAITADVKIGADVISQAIDLNTKGNTSINFSSKIGERTSIDIVLSDKTDKGEIKLRVLYFLPSTIKTEY